MRRASDQELAVWDRLIQANPDGGNVLQCLAFALTKQKFGWTPRYFVNDPLKLAILVLTRKLPGLGELAYIPKGPGVKDVAQLEQLLPELQESPAFLLKLEPELPKTVENLEVMKRLGMSKTRDLQFNYATIDVDLHPDEETLINSFKQKTRYNIRLAERKGVKIRAIEPTAENFKTMYQLMQEVGKRTGVFVRSYGYFETFWRMHAERDCGQLFFAEYEGKILAGVFVTFLGKKALYKDGGSTREHSNLQAPYLLQWEIMRWLKARGVETYDLHGVPGQDENSPEHPRHGLWLFKSGFNEHTTEYIGTWDLPLNTAKYRRWQKFGERLATGYTYRVKKELFY